MKILLRILSLLALALFVWYLFLDRMTPYTANARVKALVVDAVPQVSGVIAAVAVSNGQVVEQGTLLARLDDRPFRLAVDEARAALDLATQQVGAGSSGVEVALAGLATATSNLQNAEVQSARVFELEEKGIASPAQADNARATLAEARSAVAEAEASVEQARRSLGAEGEDNPQIRAAMAQLGQAQLELEWTELRAPARGIVVDLAVAQGTFAKAGAPIITFVSFDEVWVEAYMTENNLGRVTPGQTAEIALDVQPGRIFEGVVGSITLAASHGSNDAEGLPRVPTQQAWMRDPQPFPVRILMLGYATGSEEADIRRFLNGQADVVIYTTDNALLTALAAGWLRLNSWISYAY